ncbi:hypothetical protein Nepgr_016664 [Nepenthes gracilis]|uniref:Uncharacterized protein n=1 Tax=Nepenthes gracilis TaxID=150966 RepID=A0AAD3SN35_NEPGR|nr:hypothetical protein Nepgr_016664 [Nepenthes gracilis]
MLKHSEIENCQRFQFNYEVESEERVDEEAISLRDLPISIIDEDNQPTSEKSEATEAEEDFDFRSLGGWINDQDSKMCAADDVFFRGQILPFRYSFSSDTGLISSGSDSRNPSWSISRSGSATSSRSSSTGSHYSVTSSSSSSSSKAAQKPKIRSHFHSYPSPKPQIQASAAHPVASSSPSKKYYSFPWELVRFGLLRTPEIELQDLKVRRASYSNDSTVTPSSKTSSRTNDLNRSSNIWENFKTHRNTIVTSNSNLNVQREKKYGKKGGIFNGCKCSVWVAEPVPTRVIVVNRADCGSNSATTGTDSEKPQRQPQGKQAVSRHRSFEWPNDISNGDVVNPF